MKLLIVAAKPTMLTGIGESERLLQLA